MDTSTIVIVFILSVFIFIVLFTYITENNGARGDITHEIHKESIPLHIYQTWHSKYDLPEKMRECKETLHRQNPEFVHYLFDDNDCRKFIKDNYSDDVVKAYDSLIPGAYKADLWRYCILYKKGGVYMDIKFKCADGVKLIDLVHKSCYVEDYAHGGQRGVYNGVMICKKGDPKLLKAINSIVINVQQKYYGETALSPTGPGLLGRIFTDHEFRDIPFRFIADSKHDGAHGSHDSHKIIRKSDNKILFVMYPEYRAEQLQYKDSHPHYHQLWYKRQIYR
jgi:hypothetical protein